MSIAEQVRQARMRSVPLIGVCTPDPADTIAAINGVINGAPALVWDIAQGLRPAKESGQGWVERLWPDSPDQAQALSCNPTETLNAIKRLPAKALVYMMNAQRFTPNEGVAQAIWNLRDEFKRDRRTLVLLGPSMDLPPEIAADVVVLEEEYPSDDTLGKIVTSMAEAAKIPALAEPDKARAVTALHGMASFPAEQAVAMSMSESGLDIPSLWDRKRKTVEQSRGIKFDRGNPTFDIVGGLAQFRNFATRIFSGPKPPSLVVRIEEIDKAMAGAGGKQGTGDSSGVSQDFNGVMLTCMEDYGWRGMILNGPPGSGKSLGSRAFGSSFGVETVSLDTGALKGSYVGESERAIRNAMKIIKSIAGDGAFFIATCNKWSALPPEMLRRYRCGMWMFDLPTAEERAPIWGINLKKFGLDASQQRPDDNGWTGADIRNCCENAYTMACSLVEAAETIVPVSRSNAGDIEAIRKAADGKFLSASYPGVYRNGKRDDAGTRDIELGG